MDYVEKREMILKGNIKGVILKMAAPIMINNLVQTSYNLVDTYFVSRVGDVQVAAASFVWPVLFFIISLGMGINVAGMALISQYIGAGKDEKAKEVAGHIISFSMLFSLCLAFLGYYFTPQILKAMGAEGELLYNSTIYLRIMFFDIPFLFLTFIFTSIRQAQGDTVTPMIINVSGALLNVILDPLFIMTFKMGIGGAAIATVLSKAVFCIYIFYYLFIKNDGIHLEKHDLILKKDVLLKVLKIGLPSSLGQSGEALGFVVLVSFIASFGNETITAFGLGNKINSIIMMPAGGIASALSAIVGQNLGASNLKRVSNAFKVSIKLSLEILTVGGIVLFFLAPYLIGIFSKNPEILKEGTYYLKLISITVPLMGIFQICVGTFQGSGHTMYVMLMEILRLWGIRLPLILILKRFTSLGSSVVWYSMITSNLCICILGLSIYFSKKWQKPVIKETEKLP